jgi:hypothetical protein
MRKLAFVLMVFTMVAACKKDDNADGEILADFVQCNKDQNLDSVEIAAKLIGSWRLIKQSAAYSGEFVSPDKNITATFKTDSTYTVTENTNIIQQGKWGLIYYSVNYYGLQTDAFSPYLGGAVYLCNNRLLLAQSFYDGPDYVFEK